MRAGDLVQSLVIEVISTHCRGELIEISDHRGGEIQVEFSAREIADPESVPDALWNEDERPGRTRELAEVDEPPFARADYERSLVTRHGRTRGCHAGIRASKPPPRRAPAKERENALCSCPGPCEPRELAAHAIDLRAVHE